jgi:hypothetical protein
VVINYLDIVGAILRPLEAYTVLIVDPDTVLPPSAYISPPPRLALSGFSHVSAPTSEPIGMVWNRQISLPVVASKPITRPAAQLGISVT